MANKNLLTYGAKTALVEQAFYSPVAQLSNGQPISTMYCVLCRVDPWIDENNPDQPLQSQQYIKQIYNNIFVAKKINSNNISPVIPRIDWTSGTVYQYYQDNIDMFNVDLNNTIVQQFYVKNRYNQVFKCLWNANGAVSTNEPVFQPGTFGSNGIYQSTDGYKWKYIYSIDVGSAVKFLDNNWIPVPVGVNTPNPLSTAEGFGGVEAINVTYGGVGYNTSNAAITVSITGDGTGASAHVVANNISGAITDIVVDSQGSNYTYANVSILSTQGSGATAIAPVSPIGGHGFDPVSELGCNHVMYTVEFNGSEGGIMPTDIDYRQVGLLVNPFDNQTLTTGIPASQSIYPVYEQVIVSSGAGTFTNDDFVYQGSSTSPTFIGTVLNFDSGNNLIKLINTTGTININNPIFDSLGTARTVLGSSSPTGGFVRYSGYLAYIENRAGVQRSPDGIEQFKFVLGY